MLVTVLVQQQSHSGCRVMFTLDRVDVFCLSLPVPLIRLLGELVFK